MKAEYVPSTEPASLDPKSTANYVSLENVYLGVNATDSLSGLKDALPQEIEKLRTAVRDFVIESVVQIQKRFSFMYEDLFTNSKFLQPENAKNLNPSTLTNIAKQFPNFQFDLPKLESQWREQSLLDNKETDTVKYWTKLFSITNFSGNPKLAELNKLTMVFFSLPFSNAVTERLFSCLKNVKTDKRNRLDAETLSSVLCVKYGAKRTKKDSAYFINNKVSFPKQVKSSATAQQSKDLRLGQPSGTSTSSQQ